jgi:hypothetical protein
MTINERYIQFSGSKSGGSQRIPVPFELEVDQDIEVTINQHNFTFNVVKQEIFSNQDGSVNVVYLLKSTAE